jgi:hypothetical protein
MEKRIEISMRLMRSWGIGSAQELINISQLYFISMQVSKNLNFKLSNINAIMFELHV